MSDDKIVWVGRLYRDIGRYTNLHELKEIIDQAIEAENKGEWKEIYLDANEDDGSVSIYLTGSRPETEQERSMREAHEAKQKEYRRQSYENLKKEFEGK